MAQVSQPASTSGVVTRGSRFQPVFPAAMGAIWKRKRFAGLEMLWRWLGASPFLLLAAFAWQRHAPALVAAVQPLAEATVFRPAEAGNLLAQVLQSCLPILHAELFWLPLCAIAWLLAASLGRPSILRRLARTIGPGTTDALGVARKSAPALPLQPKPLTAFLITASRALLLAVLYTAWATLLLATWRRVVSDPAAQNSEPHVVLFSAVAVTSALLLFALWSALNWPLNLALILVLRPGATLRGSLRDALASSRRLRNELIEINLIMGIVRLASLVTLLVLSACPLPFASVETTGFLVGWNLATAVLWLLASDFFQTVRHALSIRVLRTWSPLLDA